MKFSSQVPANRTSPQPVADYLAQRFTYHDHAQWIRLITAGKIVIDGNRASVNDCVHGRQTVVYDAGEFEEPPADLGYGIIYEDDWLLAVNKPGNLLIHRAGRSFRNNLMYQLRFRHRPPYPAAYSIHRLDRNTSGIVLIAKSPEIQAEISDQFIDRKVHKRYQAIVEGVPDGSIEKVEFPIARDLSAETVPKFGIDKAGKDACTVIESLRRIGDGFSLLHLKPLTGRTHQLRVHCAAIGHPIVGDRLYGATVGIDGRPLPAVEHPVPGTVQPRHALHCGRIEFYHPWKKTRCRLETPLPTDMENFITLLADTKNKGA